MKSDPSYLTPAAMKPLRAGAGFTGALLYGLRAFIAAAGRITVFILAHHHTPLKSSGTGTRALRGAKGEHKPDYERRTTHSVRRARSH